jgi:hypothetical protein
MANQYAILLVNGFNCSTYVHTSFCALHHSCRNYTTAIAAHNIVDIVGAFKESSFGSKAKSIVHKKSFSVTSICTKFIATQSYNTYGDMANIS